MRYACGVLILLVAPALWAAAPTPELLQAIQANTFEVVMKKPEKDPLTYEKPLPLELLPYSERTDLYRSIGTAFALGHNQYVTAAHVIIAGVDSQFGAPALRRVDGKLFLIDRILKFSAYQDFVVFSLQGEPAPAGLAVNRAPKLTDPVLAVGNALGEGVVIRDGLYTSDTAEEQDGRWKWIRFSAAASPGNSGGPLLDQDGKVIGIVIGKSPNENLNYSLPIAQVLDAPDRRARFDQRVLVALPYLQRTQTYRFQEAFDLPLSWPEFATSYQAIINHHDELSRTALLKTYAGELFPKGSGADSVLYEADANGFQPRVIAQGDDNNWAAFSPGYSTTDLPGDGSVSVALDRGFALLRLIRPGNATDDAFYGNSKAFMDLALKALNLRRPVGTDQVRITSLGAAQNESDYVDHYGRKWQERSWAVPFMDIYLQCMLLPTPDGYVGLFQYVPSLLRASMQARSRLMVDQIDVSFNGTLPQWRAYLARRTLLPAALGDVKLENSPQWKLQTKRFVFNVPPELLSLTDKSVLSLTMGFVPQGTQAVWDIENVWWNHDEARRAALGLSRRLRPPESANRELRTAFEDMRNRHAPYDGAMQRSTGNSYELSGITEVPAAAAGMVSAELLYAVTLRMDGPADPGRPSQVYKQLAATAQIIEKAATGNTMPASEFASAKSIAAAADYDAAQERYKLDIEKADKRFGRDLRGRLYSEDMDELKAWSQKQMTTPGAVVEQVMKTFNARGIAAHNYWMTVPAIMHNRDLWPSFLSLNHLPATTPHSAEIVAAEKALLDSLSDEPSETSGELGWKLADAYVDERAQAGQRLHRELTDADFRTRQSQCPAPAGRTSGRAVVSMQPMRLTPAQFYPYESRKQYLAGRIVLRLLVSDTGCALKFGVQVSSGSAELDDAAVRLAETLEFLPAERGGKAVESSASLPVNFQMMKAAADED